MRSATALVIAIAFIFGAAMVAEFAGIVPREATAPTAEASPGDSPAPAEGELTDEQWSKLRIGAIGGFVVACIFILMRATGDYF